jgi:hypothetical protein
LEKFFTKYRQKFHGEKKKSKKETAEKITEFLKSELKEEEKPLRRFFCVLWFEVNWLSFEIDWFCGGLKMVGSMVVQWWSWLAMFGHGWSCILSELFS